MGAGVMTQVISKSFLYIVLPLFGFDNGHRQAFLQRWHKLEQEMKNVLLFENAPWDQGDLWHTETDLLKGPISATKRSQVGFCDSQRGQLCGLSE